MAKDVSAGRARIFDLLRGISVISMVGFHLCYDLRFIAGRSLPWFEPPFQDIWRASISWSFIFIAGCMCLYSRDNLRRSCKYLACALAIFLVTWLAAVDVPINFGVIFCMGACTLTYWLLERIAARPHGVAAGIILFAGFLALLGLQTGQVWMFGANLAVPKVLYSTEWFSWLGFPGPRFSSGDYYPVLPYLLLFLSGASFMASWKKEGLPERLCKPLFPPIEWVGRHALEIYLLHQPILLLAVGIL